MLNFFKKNSIIDQLSKVMLNCIASKLNKTGASSFAEELHEAVLERAVLYARINVTACRNVKYRRALNILFVRNYPVSNFFCNNFAAV